MSTIPTTKAREGDAAEEGIQIHLQTGRTIWLNTAVATITLLAPPPLAPLPMWRSCLIASTLMDALWIDMGILLRAEIEVGGIEMGKEGMGSKKWSRNLRAISGM